jgi:hypothetical protein
VYYGRSKARQMARSILPSKAPRMARDTKKAINRKHRRQYRQLAADPELLDSRYWHHQCNWERLELRSDRRAADKLAHFERWAARVTKGMRKEDRLSAMRSLLPEGLIGEHALSHLRFLPEFDIDPLRRSYQNPVRRLPQLSRQQLTQALRRVAADPEQLADLNGRMAKAHRTARIKQVKSDQWGRQYAEYEPLGFTQPPPLAKPNDVGRFLSACYRAAKIREAGQRHPEWLQTVKRFVAGSP